MSSICSVSATCNAPPNWPARCAPPVSRSPLASGGKSAPRQLDPGIEFCQLPPAYSADGSFSELLDENGSPVDDDWRQRERLKRCCRSVSTGCAFGADHRGLPVCAPHVAFRAAAPARTSPQDRHCLVVIFDSRYPAAQVATRNAMRKSCSGSIVLRSRTGTRRSKNSPPSTTVFRRPPERRQDRLHRLHRRRFPGSDDTAGIRREVVVSAGGSDTGLACCRPRFPRVR